MILQSLSDYYDRSDAVADIGWEWKRIPYIIEISANGEFVQLTSLRNGKKASDTTPSLVPKANIRSGTRAYEAPNTLWDHTGYTLGYAKSSSRKDQQTAKNQLEHFRARVSMMLARCPESPGLKAVNEFYERREYNRVFQDPLWNECIAIPGCNTTFRLITETDIALHEPNIRRLVTEDLNFSEGASRVGLCLVTGNTEEVQRTHFPIAGIGKEKPAPLSAINDDTFPAFSSFGKHQGENFPVGRTAAFKYSTALNHLMRPNSTQKIQLGETTVVFWAQRADPMEDWLASIVGGDDPDAHIAQVGSLYTSIQSGGFAGARGEQKFFVLALAPNAARIVVRLWHVAPLREIAYRVNSWFDDIEICMTESDRPYPGLSELLRSLCLSTNEKPRGDISKLPPRLSDEVVRSVLVGGELPQLMLMALLQRCRADQAKKDSTTGKPIRHVSALRAALLRAIVNRGRRAHHLSEKEIAVSLDKSNTEAPYLLGRLFATYERVQELAAGRELNRTIRDSYFGSAMGSPQSVYARLAQLNQVHMRELKRATPRVAVYFDKLLLEISDKMTPEKAYPARATPAAQGVFTLGYYHQRHDFFEKPGHKAAPTLSTQGAD